MGAGEELAVNYGAALCVAAVASRAAQWLIMPSQQGPVLKLLGIPPSGHEAALVARWVRARSWWRVALQPLQQ